MSHRRRAGDSLLMRFIATAAGVAVGVAAGALLTIGIVWLFISI